MFITQVNIHFILSLGAAVLVPPSLNGKTKTFLLNFDDV